MFGANTSRRSHASHPIMSAASAASSALIDAVQQMRVHDDADAGAPGGAPVSQSPAAAAAAAPLLGECDLDAPELNVHWASVLPALLQPVRPAGQPTLFFTDAGAAPVAADEAGAGAEGAAPDAAAAAAAAVPSLYDVFVSALPADVQRWWRGCRTCDRFIQRYASLAVLRDDPTDADAAAAAAAETGAAEGAEKEKDEKRRPLRLVPLLWAVDPAADSDAARFAPALRAMRALFTAETKITGVFVPVKTNQPAQPGGAAVKQQGCTIGVPLSIAQPRPAAAAAAQGEPNVEVAAPRTFPHMSVTFPPSCCQDSASNQHDTLFEMLSRALENNIRDIEKAHDLLTKNMLDYADQHKAPIEMLYALAQRVAGAEPSQRDLAIWHCAAGCHPGMVTSVRSGMVSNLLADLYAEMPLEAVRARWAALANPENYMRATTAPSAGNVAAAERLFEQLGLSSADLERRYLRRDEVPERVVLFRDVSEAVAVPVPTTTCAPDAQPPASKEKKPAKKGGVFGHLAPKGDAGPSAAGSNSSAAGGAAAAAAAAPPTKQMSFLEFVRKELPSVRRLEAKVPEEFGCVFFITGNAGTAPLMQWHTATNLVSQYTYGAVQPAAKWGLESGAWTRVHTLLPFAHQWPVESEEGEGQGENGGAAKSPAHSFAQHGRKYLLALEGAKDGNGVPGPSLFPVYLKSAFHGVRSTIEAHNNTAKMQGADYLERRGVAGLCVDVGEKPNPAPKVQLRATDAHGKVTLYELTCEGEGKADVAAAPQPVP